MLGKRRSRCQSKNLRILRCLKFYLRTHLKGCEYHLRPHKWGRWTRDKKFRGVQDFWSLKVSHLRDVSGPISGPKIQGSIFWNLDRTYVDPTRSNIPTCLKPLNPIHIPYFFKFCNFSLKFKLSTTLLTP